ncbi:hypothetical protein M436DRAFT_61614 [Aureobasidium namibiae CBS 147.97]|uniref:Uncharacterized protein n=1 Tax=Aureobasidium namibiae CBS 147.97 TaxID=1043004 RepID=A0A074WPV8_9PEZI
MLSITAISTFLLSLASAAVVRQPQQPIVPSTTNLTDLIHVRKFAIDDMNDAKFRLHHVAARALLGDVSYITLREAEMEQREQDIWQYLWDHDLECPDWDTDTENRPLFDYRPKLWFSGDRVFDVDPAHVPGEVITALHKLSEEEWEHRQDMRNQRICNVTKSADPDSNVPFEIPEESGHVVIPDEYMQYLIPEDVIKEEDKLIDEMWKARDDSNKKKILAGKRSVRDVKMPDLSKCTKEERHISRGF